MVLQSKSDILCYDGVTIHLMCADGTGEGEVCPAYVHGILLQACSFGLHMPVCNAWFSWSWYRLPKGLEDVSKYPDLIAELLRRNWTDTEVRGVLADNLLRVFFDVEQVRRKWPFGFPALPPTTRLAV